MRTLAANEPEHITLCVPIRHPDGSIVYEPLQEYQRNPAPGSFIDWGAGRVGDEARDRPVSHPRFERVV